jgi:hypothetical protein
MTEPTSTTPAPEPNDDDVRELAEARGLMDEAQPLLTAEQTTEDSESPYSVTAAERAWIKLDADLDAAVEKAIEGGVDEPSIDSELRSRMSYASYQARLKARENAASAKRSAQHCLVKAKAHCELAEAAMNLIAHLDEYEDAPLVIAQAGNIVAILVQSAKDLAFDVDMACGSADRIESVFYGERIAQGDAK